MLTSSQGLGMFEAVEIEGQAEQQGLANLGHEAATRCFRGELAFDDREHRFYFGAWPIQFVRKLTVHLVANLSVGNAASASGNDTAGPQRGADVPVIAFPSRTPRRPAPSRWGWSGWRSPASRAKPAHRCSGLAALVAPGVSADRHPRPPPISENDDSVSFRHSVARRGG